mgnify:CR=1 FL=1
MPLEPISHMDVDKWLLKVLVKFLVKSCFCGFGGDMGRHFPVLFGDGLAEVYDSAVPLCCSVNDVGGERYVQKVSIVFIKGCGPCAGK